MRSIVLRLACGAALVASLGMSTLTAAATPVPTGPTLEVANPTPGDMITPGALTIQGQAFDPMADTGAGVDRVSVFLGDRGTGGQFLGDATLGQPTIMTMEGLQVATAGWQLTTPALSGAGDGRTLFVYARSAVTGDETVMQIPITIGESEHAATPPAVSVEPAAPVVQPASGAIAPTADYILPAPEFMAPAPEEMMPPDAYPSGF